MKNKNNRTYEEHWTKKSTENFQYFVAADFVDQLRECADLRGLNQRDLAKKLELSESRVSQVFNDPGNLTLNTMIDWTRVLGFKTSIVVYDDNDVENRRGPLSGSIFSECWKKVGCPLEWPGTEAQLFDNMRIAAPNVPTYPAQPTLEHKSKRGELDDEKGESTGTENYGLAA